MDITIKKTCIGDAEAIAETESLCFSSPESAATVISALENPLYRIFTAFCEDRIAGHSITVVCGGEADILSVAVRPEFRRKGIGRRLLEKTEAEASSSGASEIFLEVRKSNTPAIALYVSEGFSAVGERRNFYEKPREDAILMKKLIEIKKETL